MRSQVGERCVSEAAVITTKNPKQDVYPDVFLEDGHVISF
jgi:hypothetical protein